MSEREFHTEEFGPSPDTRHLPMKGASAGADRPDETTSRAFAYPCLYCGTDENEVPFEDTEEHRDTSQHQWAVYDS